MITATALLVLIGLCDLLHTRDLAVPDPSASGGSIMPTGVWRRAVLIIAAAGLTTLLIATSPWLPLIGFLLGGGIWLLTYRQRTQGPAMLGTALLLAALALPALTARPDSAGLLEPYPVALAAIAVVLINLSTANRIVRVVLRLAGPAMPAPEGEPGLRAGRIIGVLERFLLLILIITGQGLAIAGVAAAKSIIRYPEISRSAREGGGLSAEVFFIGTVTSWLVALASGGLFLLAIG